MPEATLRKYFYEEGMRYNAFLFLRTAYKLSILLVLMMGISAARGQVESGADVETESGSTEPASPLAVPAYRQATNLAVITIEGEIDEVTFKSVERRLKEAEQNGADGVVFEINTFGGLATAALEICELIKNSPIPKTTAWIHPKAYSAGTFIALACNEIVLSPHGTIGDCAPILPGLIPIPVAERAKIESPLLEEVMESAEMHGYDAKLCIAFVAVDMELWMVRNRETGTYRFVDRKDYQFLFGEDPPDDARLHGSGGIPTGESGFSRGNERIERYVLPGRSSGNMRGNRDNDGSKPTMKERIAEAARQLPMPPTALPLTESDKGKYDLIEPVVNAKQLLVLKTPRAMRYGFGKKIIANDAELKRFVGATTLVRYNRNWSEGLVRVLTSIPVRILFVIVFAIGLLWEMATPGVGVPGSIALVALLVLLGAPALTGLAQWWDIAFVLLGIALIAAEIFVIPGFGIAGVSGIILLGMGFVGTFVGPDPGGGLLPSSPAAQQQGLRGLFSLLVSFFAGGVGIYFLSRHIDRLPIFNRLVLSNTGMAEGEVTMLRAMEEQITPLPKVGMRGSAITSLRPAGRARIEGVLYDVVSGRGVIEPDTEVIVKSVNSFRILVEKACEYDDADDSL